MADGISAARLTPVQLDVLSVLWEAGPAGSAEIARRVRSRGRRFSDRYAAVVTYRMVRLDLLRAEEQIGRRVYAPTVSLASVMLSGISSAAAAQLIEWLLEQYPAVSARVLHRRGYVYRDEEER